MFSLFFLSAFLSLAPECFAFPPSDFRVLPNATCEFKLERSERQRETAEQNDGGTTINSDLFMTNLFIY